MILDDAAMKIGVVTHRAIVTHVHIKFIVEGMHAAVVLDARMVTDNNVADISPKNSTEPIDASRPTQQRPITVDCSSIQAPLPILGTWPSKLRIISEPPHATRPSVVT